jgi:hypothetical protein
MRPALNLVRPPGPSSRAYLSLHTLEAPEDKDLLRPLFTCTNTNQAATCNSNTQPRVSPHHVVNHASHQGTTIYRSSDAPVLNTTFSGDPQGLQYMMNKTMHQTMIDKSTVLANTIQNHLTETLKKERKRDTWDLHTFNQGNILQCSQRDNQLRNRLMIQQYELHHLNRSILLLLSLHRMLGRFRIRMSEIILKILLL